MDQFLQKGIAICVNQIQPLFEEYWSEIVDKPIDSYRILIWGSTVQDKERIPTDLDIIIEYSVTSKVDSARTNSIESILEDKVNTGELFEYADIIVQPKEKTASKIGNSRVSKVYSALEDKYITF